VGPLESVYTTALRFGLLLLGASSEALVGVNPAGTSIDSELMFEDEFFGDVLVTVTENVWVPPDTDDGETVNEKFLAPVGAAEPGTVVTAIRATTASAPAQSRCFLLKRRVMLRSPPDAVEPGYAARRLNGRWSPRPKNVGRR
jgi:hypothetical protein